MHHYYQEPNWAILEDVNLFLMSYSFYYEFLFMVKDHTIFIYYYSILIVVLMNLKDASYDFYEYYCKVFLIIKFQWFYLITH